jgi:prepilin-type processing-associated H-X9-DG protein
MQESRDLIPGPGKALFHRCGSLLFIGTATELHNGRHVLFADNHVNPSAVISF